MTGETDSTTEYKLTLGEAGCLGTSPCCDMDVWKIEFHVWDKCRGSVGNMWINTNYGLAGNVTEGRSPTYASYGPDKLVFKITRLGWGVDSAYGSSIVISLKKGSACPDKESFFVDDNVYAISNKANRCCPVSYFGALVNPSGSIFSPP